jgi:BCD family chlorophyll transporter-like MFS transporter
MAFTMEDVLLEPYGGEILGLDVSSTTYLSATLALGSLIGFVWASHALSKGLDAIRMSAWGAWIGVPGLLLVILAQPLAWTPLFVVGVGLIGLGAGLFGHGTLTATMQRSSRDEVGLALGAWGAVQATAAGLALALGGILRDFIASMTSSWTGYCFVYSIEVLMLVVTLVVMRGMTQRSFDFSSTP